MRGRSALTIGRSIAVLSVFLMGQVPAQAEEQPTIADVIEASSSSRPASTAGWANTGTAPTIGAQIVDFQQNVSVCTSNRYNPNLCRMAPLAGAQVHALDPSGPAFAAGLRSGDVVVAVYTQAGQRRTQISNAASLERIIRSNSAGQSVFLDFRVLLPGETYSQHWKRQKLAHIILAPAAKSSTYTSIARKIDTANVLETEKRSFQAQLALQRRTASSQSFVVKPYSEEEAAKFKTTASVSNNSACLADGSYPKYPMLDYPKGFRTREDTTFGQIGTADAEDVAGFIGNAGVSLANARLILEKVLGTYTRLRDQFWVAYDQGQATQDLQNEYSYWLVQAHKLRGQLSDVGAMGGGAKVFEQIVARGIDANLNFSLYPVTARSLHEFHQYSRCSLKNSDYAPERQIADKWFTDSEFEAMYHGNGPGFKPLPISQYVRYENSGPPMDSFNDCARWEVTQGRPIDACMSKTKEAVVQTGPRQYSQDAALENFRVMHDDAVNFFASYAEQGQPQACTAKEASTIIKYFFYARPDLSTHPEKRWGFGRAIAQFVCESADVDLQHDRIDAYLRKQEQSKQIEPDYWTLLVPF